METVREHNEIRQEKLAELHETLTFEFEVAKEDSEQIHAEVTAFIQDALRRACLRHGGTHKFLEDRLGPYAYPRHHTNG